MPKTYEGRGRSVEEALSRAHAQIPPSAHRDFATSRVVEWGMQKGGIANATLHYVIVEEDPNAPFRT